MPLGQRGDHYVICDRCGAKVWARLSQMEWQGLRVCRGCYDRKHPNDTPVVTVDVQRVANPRPRPEPVFISPTDVTPEDL